MAATIADRRAIATMPPAKLPPSAVSWDEGDVGVVAKRRASRPALRPYLPSPAIALILFAVLGWASPAAAQFFQFVAAWCVILSRSTGTGTARLAPRFCVHIMALIIFSRFYMIAVAPLW